MGSGARLRWTVVAGCVLVAISAGVLTACGADPDAITSSIPTTVTAPPPGQAEDFRATAADFTNIHDMTPVRGFFVDNRLGHLAEAVAMAKANKGGIYPVGTILQLVPQEVMVKRRKGWNPATKDWEFFFLDIDAKGTTIVTRGADEVVNRFGGNCASCHQQAKAKYDLVCENSHGCDPLPIDHTVIEAIQAGDPRPLAPPS